MINAHVVYEQFLHKGDYPIVLAFACDESVFKLFGQYMFSREWLVGGGSGVPAMKFIDGYGFGR